MPNLTLIEWITLLGVIPGAIALAWTISQEVRRKREEQASRLTVRTWSEGIGILLQVSFARPASHTRYWASVENEDLVGTADFYEITKAVVGMKDGRPEFDQDFSAGKSSPFGHSLMVPEADGSSTVAWFFAEARNGKVLWDAALVFSVSDGATDKIILKRTLRVSV